MFKKNILAITLTSTLAMLSGCDSDNSNTDNDDQKPTPTNVLQYVNPFVGTGFNGHTFPAQWYRKAWCNSRRIPN